MYYGMVIGQDAFNNKYWYNELKLFKENTSKKPVKRDFDCICSTLLHWQNFLKQYQNSTCPAEKDLFAYVNETLFPVIEPQLKAKEGAKDQKGFIENNKLSKRERVEAMTKIVKKPGGGNGETDDSTVVKSDDVKKETPDSGDVGLPSVGQIMPSTPATPQSQGQPSNGSDDKKNLDLKMLVSTPQTPSQVNVSATKVQRQNSGKNQAANTPQTTNNTAKASTDPQYMQQQSQIFVFTTQMANKAAELVMQSVYPSIIAFHCAQPGTKNFLQKYPMKMQQWNRFTTPLMNQTGSKPGLICSVPVGSSRPLEQLQDKVNQLGNEWPNQPGSWGATSSPSGVNQGPPMSAESNVMSKGENLTPQNLQRREEQLRKIRRMQEVLFPEKCQPSVQHPGCPPDNYYAQQSPVMMPGMQQRPMMGMPPHRMAQPQSPERNQAQIEWQRLQEQYAHEKQVVTMGHVHRHPQPGMPPQNHPQHGMPVQVQGQLQPNHLMNQNVSGPPGPPPSYNQSLGHRLLSINGRASPTSPHFPLPHMPQSFPSPVEFGPRGPGVGSPPRHPVPPGGLDQNYNSPDPMLSKLQQERMFKSGVMMPRSPQDFPSPLPGEPIYGPKPPAYVQAANKIKDMDPRKDVIPVPSPQPMCYVSAFDSQELTIQKQLNTAYMEPSVPTSVGYIDEQLKMFPADGQFDQSGQLIHTNVPQHASLPGSVMNHRVGSPLNQRVHPGTLNVQGDANFPQNMPAQISSQQGLMHQQDVYLQGSRLSHFDPPGCAVPRPNLETIPGELVPHDAQQFGRQPLQHMPPTVNNTYVNATMSIQQLNIQNVPGSAYSANMQVGQTNDSSSAHHANAMAQSGMAMHQSMSMGVPQMPSGYTTVSASQGSLMHTSSMSQQSRRGPAPAVPFKSTNVQVQANTPNTIQYRPVNPRPSLGINRPPNVDFLQRFASPVGTMEKKTSKQNMQYFPSGVGMKGEVIPQTPGMYLQNPMDPSQHLMQSVGGTSQVTGHPGMGMQGPNNPNIVAGPGMAAHPGMAMPNQHMQASVHMTGGMQHGLPPTGPGPGTKIMMPDPQMSVQAHMQQNMPGMSQSMHINSAMQPLDPNQPYYPPVSSDPAYNVQFQNFQKQLYATNSKSKQQQQHSSSGLPPF